MNKKRASTKILVVIFLLIFITLSSLTAGRTISSQTIYIYGYVPERTTLNILEDGHIDFSSNNPYATVDVLKTSYATTLSVTAL